MQKKIFILLLTLMFNSIYAQDFEGTVTYKNSCIKTDPRNSFDLDKFVRFMGDTLEFKTKRGSYKQITNGVYKPYQLYNSSEPVHYYKDKIASDTLYFIDYRKYNEFQYEHTIEQNSDTILGYVCHKLTITFKKNGNITHYYFAPDLGQDPKYFEGYKHDNLNNIIALMKSVILKIESLGGGLTIIREAFEVKHQKLSDNVFDIPKDKFMINKSKVK